MPALSNGNTCWGNRKAFSLHSEFICDSFHLGGVFEETGPARQDFVSSNTYYGYHRVPQPASEPSLEIMCVDEVEEPPLVTREDLASSCRKRPSQPDQQTEISKRIRQQEPQGLEEGRSIPVESRPHSFNTSFCLV